MSQIVVLASMVLDTGVPQFHWATTGGSVPEERRGCLAIASMVLHNAPVQQCMRPVSVPVEPNSPNLAGRVGKTATKSYVIYIMPNMF